MRPNGLNLRKSLDLPNSNTGKVLRFLYQFGPYRKVTVINYALGKMPREGSKRGYASNLFSEMGTHGLIFYNKRRNVWNLTKYGTAVAKRHLKLTAKAA